MSDGSESSAAAVSVLQRGGPATTRDEVVCPQCSESSPASFASCWHCGAEIPSDAPPAQATPAIATEVVPSDHLPPSTLGRSVIAFEVAAVVGLLFVGNTISIVAHPASVTVDIFDASSQLVLDLSASMVLAYLIWRDRGSLAAIGLARIKWPREVAFGLLLWVGLEALTRITWPLLVRLGEPERPDFDPFSEVSGSPVYPAVLLVGAAFEEIMYRGYLVVRLVDLRVGTGLALLLSTAMFAGSHGYGLTDTLAVFVFGLALGVCFLSARRLPRLVIAHWAFNLALQYWRGQ